MKIFFRKCRSAYLIHDWFPYDRDSDLERVKKVFVLFLGVSIRFCSFDGAAENVWHVLVSKDFLLF